MAVESVFIKNYKVYYSFNCHSFLFRTGDFKKIDMIKFFKQFLCVEERERVCELTQVMISVLQNKKHVSLFIFYNFCVIKFKN